MNAVQSTPKRTRRWFVRALWSALTLVLLLAGAFVACVGPAYSKKYAPGEFQVPSPKPASFEIDRQDEGHTCGYHALCVIYRAYCVHTERARLRERLGVDKPAIPKDSSSLGLLHPDLLRVVAQDGFLGEVLSDPFSEVAEEKLAAHLAEHPALALIELSGGLMHWVVLTDYADGRVTVFDSLATEPYQRDWAEFADRELLSVITIRPGEDARSRSKLHAIGTSEMARVAGRMRK